MSKKIEDAIELTSTDNMFKEFEKEEKEHPIRVRIRRFGYRIERVYKDIRYFIRSNIFFCFHGFYPSSWWGFYTYNARRNAKILKYFLKHSIAHRTQPPEQKAFFDALKEIIKGFDLIVEDDYDYIPSKRMRERLIKKNPKLFSHKKFVKAEANYKQIQKALKLFSKYYFWLWD